LEVKKESPDKPTMDGIEIGPAVGSCGTAAYIRQPVMVRDIATDPLWKELRDLALGSGLRACWSTPILAADAKVLGTLAVYYRTPKRPTRLDKQIVTTVLRTVLIAIERTQRIQRLEESEERFRALSACSPVGIFMTDADDQCVYCNARCCEICGFSAQEAQGMGWADFLHPEDKQRVLANRNRLREGSDGYEAEQRWIHPDGTVRWTVVRKAPVKTESGKVLGYMGTIADRTKRHAEEEKAGSIARHLDAVVRVSPVAIICFDLDRNVRCWHPMAEKILGWKEEEIIGKELAIPFSQREQWKELRAKLLRGESFHNVLTTRLHKDGHEVDVLISDSPTFDKDGRIAGFVGSIVNATELVQNRKLLEAMVTELRDSEQRFRTLADNIDQFAWMMDETGRVLWCNRRWFDYTGIAPEQMEGAWREKIHHPDHVDRVVRRFQESREKGETWEDIFPLRGKDGNYHWFLTRAHPVRDDTGRIIRWFGTNTDITERMLAEEALRRSEKLAIAGKLAATVAHELNNPLAAAINLLYLASQRATDPVQRKYLVNAEQELGRVSRMANRTLSFYRGNTAKRPISLVPLLQEMVSVFAPGCAQKNIVLSVAARSSAMVHGSKDELRQVFSNLLSNAIDAIGCDGRIEIRITECNGGVRVTIADTGRGISEPDRKKVFEPFFTTKAAGGTGVGLWITREIVAGHSGSIRLKSRSNGKPGTVVSVRLPVLSIAKPAAQGAA
jgi:PAS domain S-box-containing protein